MRPNKASLLNCALTMNKLGRSLTASVVVNKDKDETRYEIKPSRKGAIAGAVTGIAIGRFFGPVGMAVGALVGGTLGYVLGSDDD